MTQPDIYTIEARRRVAAMEQAPGMAEAILSGRFTPAIIDLLAAASTPNPLSFSQAKSKPLERMSWYED